MSESFVKLGEDMIIDKIHEIFKDAPKERKIEDSLLNRTVKQSIWD